MKPRRAVALALAGWYLMLPPIGGSGRFDFTVCYTKPMKIELARFKVKEDKSARVDEWMQMLRDNRDACIDTLAGEKMYVEAIFREKKDGQDYLYWFDVQGEGGIPVAQSEHEIDKKHLVF